MKDAKLEVSIDEKGRVRVVLSGDEEMYVPLLFEAAHGVAEALNAEPKTLTKALYDAFEWLEKEEKAEHIRNVSDTVRHKTASVRGEKEQP